MRKINGSKVEEARFKIHTVGLALRGLIEQDPSLGSDLYPLVGMLQEAKVELQEALKEGV